MIAAAKADMVSDVMRLTVIRQTDKDDKGREPEHKRTRD
jgi:hypothetical protein